jgi:hypothetical protein
MIEPSTLAKDPLSLRPGRSERLPATQELAVIRFGHAGLASWLREVNLATTTDASEAVLRTNVSMRVAIRSLLRAYFLDGGIREGRAGVREAVLTAFDRWLMVEKWNEQMKGGSVAILALYDEIADRMVGGVDLSSLSELGLFDHPPA